MLAQLTPRLRVFEKLLVNVRNLSLVEALICSTEL